MESSKYGSPLGFAIYIVGVILIPAILFTWLCGGWSNEYSDGIYYLTSHAKKTEVSPFISHLVYVHKGIILVTLPFFLAMRLSVWIREPEQKPTEITASLKMILPAIGIVLFIGLCIILAYVN